MKKILLKIPLICILGALAGCDTTVRREEMASVDYGPKPSRWREQIKSYLDIRLTNPREALVEYRSGEPKQLSVARSIASKRPGSGSPNDSSGNSPTG